MNYSKFRRKAEKLLSKFGTTTAITLLKDTGESVFDEEALAEVKQFDSIKGAGVKLNYTAEAIGSSSNIIEAGDVRILCLFDEAPTEVNDRIVYGADTFNIINVKRIDPAADVVVLYDLQCRRAY